MLTGSFVAHLTKNEYVLLAMVVFVTDSMGSAVLEYLGNIQTAAHWLSQISHKCGS